MLSKKYFVVLLITVMFAISASVLSGCGNSDAKESAAAAAAVTPAMTVGITVVQPQPLQDALHVVGIIKAHEDVLISPEEGGVVKEWRVRKGERVAKGALIVTLRDEVIKASYEAAEAQNLMSQLNYEKQGKVFEEQGMSELQYKNLQYGRDAAKANADLMKARWMRTQIKSPFEGILDEQFFDEGEFSPPGVPLAHVVNLNRLKVVADVPERQASSVRVGAPAYIAFDALPDDTVRGRVAFVGSTVSANNRALTVELDIPNPHGLLKPEMIGKVRILRESKNDALLVNESAVQLVDMNRNVVFVEVNGKAVERTVRLGGRQNNHVEIVDGIRAGDRVIVTDVEKLVDGQPVAVASERAQ